MGRPNLKMTVTHPDGTTAEVWFTGKSVKRGRARAYLHIKGEEKPRVFPVPKGGRYKAFIELGTKDLDLLRTWGDVVRHNSVARLACPSMFTNRGRRPIPEQW